MKLACTWRLVSNTVEGFIHGSTDILAPLYRNRRNAINELYRTQNATLQQLSRLVRICGFESLLQTS